MTSRSCIACLATLGLLAIPACDEAANAEGNVQEEMKDLQEARKNANQEVERLQKELESAKKRVEQLQKDMALAEQGITDEVLEARKELTRALEEDLQAVRGEISEAEEEARAHNKLINEAKSLLEQTAPPDDVKAQVESSTTVEQTDPSIETTREKKEIEIEKVKGVETKEAEQDEK